MKTTSALPATFLFFLLFAFTTTAAAFAGNGLVLDSDGDPLRNGGKYFISPVNGGGIFAGAVRHGSDTNCSLAVIRSSNRWSTTISSPFKILYISEKLPLNISFAQFAPNVCTKSKNWLVTRSYPIREPVMVGSAQEFDGSVMDGYFSVWSVDETKGHYKLVFCHTGGECGNIGVLVDINNFQRLVVTVDEPLVFKFDKVKDSSDASKLSMVV
ncbi:trypsin inhibitor B-like [Neltuma alba]|uniref:trypsin inhibitor B-like n=1 Tax=Neltuma alba TaxID=207710 RepID=UPI0010A4A953|nr:trypsin inhibitor B-like [Prosopis alba]XP_028756475.1 trypsin inhibitor B-like [Prosopis alba]